ncbi:MAG: MFS transporter [bacterium]
MNIDVREGLELVRSHPAVIFFTLGVLNNVTYVLMIAGSPEIAARSIGLVYFLAVSPALVVKGSSWWWFERVSYWWRLMVCIPVLMALAFGLVAFGPLSAQLTGVAIVAIQSALGEASCLALASTYPASERRVLLTGWSSGTGIAGIAGYVVVGLVDHLSVPFVAMLLVAMLVLPAAWVCTYSRIPGESNHDREAAAARVDDDAEERVAMVAGQSRRQYALELALGGRLERLLPYSLPLFGVYFAEYACQSGVWITIGDSEAARREFYHASNLLYQCGVFISRSSGSVFELHLSSLPWLAVFQFGLLFFFIGISLLKVSGWWLLVPAFVTGVMGGLCYVNAFRLLAHDSPPSEREKNMALTSTADSLGVGCADLFGILLQRWLS